jgi:hypothetical protein
MLATANSTSLARARRIVASPSDFARLLTIMDKRGEHRRFEHNKMQRHFFANYSLGKPVVDLLLKSRQQGATTAIVGEESRLAWVRMTRILTLIDDDKNTDMIREIAQRFYDTFPEMIDAGGVYIQRPKRSRDSATTTRYDNGSRWVTRTAGNPNAGRGSTIDVLHGSEVAHWKDAQLIIAGAQQAAAYAIWRVYETTANGAQGWFFEKAMAALDGDADYKLHFYPWWWSIEYQIPLERDETITYEPDEAELVRLHSLTPEQIKWRRSKRRELGMLFLQEYAEDAYSCFLQSGGGFFGHLDSAFEAKAGLPTPENARVVAGLDWGQANDYTVLHTTDATAARQLDILRINRMPYADMRTQIVARCKRWGIDEIVAEANSMGNTNIEELRRELREAGLKTLVTSYTTGAKNKRNDLLALNNALSTGEYTMLPDSAQRAEFRAYQATQSPSGNWQYSAPDGQHDDTVIAAMLAWHAASRSAPAVSKNPFYGHG